MRRRGFTLVELIIGMVVTAMVMLALSVVTFAVANGWQSAEAANNAYVTGGQVQTRMAQYFRPAAALGALQNGTLNSTSSPASLLFWKADLTDASNPTGDGIIEFNEIGLLRYDPASGELRFYDASDWATWSTAAQDAANVIAGTTYLEDPASISDFMTACPKYRVVMRNVSGMVLNTVETTDTPLVEYVIQLKDSNNVTSTHYGTVALRAPGAATN